MYVCVCNIKWFKLENWSYPPNSSFTFVLYILKLTLTLQSESVAANCPSNKAASLWLSEQQELLNKV